MRAWIVVAVALYHVATATAQDWSPVAMPSPLKDVKLPATAWYRCWVKTPTDWKGSDLTISLDKVHNAFEIYWDGVKVGEAGEFPPKAKDSGNDFFSFTIPDKHVRPGGQHLLAFRIHGINAKAGFTGLAPALIQEAMAMSLEGRWQFRVGDDPSWAKPDQPRPEGFLFTKVQPTSSLVETTRKAFGGLKPAEALKALTTPDDLKLEQVLAEPIVAQPVSISFDERGRLWVVQYLQYPNPAGLKMLSRDIWWRAVYDKIPAAPPNHVRGRDKITIHESTKGDGVYDKHTTFVDGLNIATAACRGRGGVWVLNPPYLLFYPTKDNADHPTGDPVVHLSGFGLEDTHSVVNSLRFGPDGWLYAAQGSTVTAEVRRPGDKEPVRMVGQNIWRYHPEKRRFEVFAEGGGNAFGVEIDAQGRLFSGHNGGNTRGFHYVQGGYYRKGFDKHGALSNPYAFGFFEMMKHPNVARFSHTFTINEADALPAPYKGKLFAVSPLQSQVVWSDVLKDGSTLQTKDVGVAIKSTDTWFRPVDIKLGPDGAIYVADWYDGQLAHTRNHEGNLDGDTGRIYRISARDAKPLIGFDLNRKTSGELVDLLRHENRWFRQTAQRILGDRKERDLIPRLTAELFVAKGQFALECLWALNLSGGFTDEVAERALTHQEPAVRSWAARLIGDESKANPTLAAALAERARRETVPEVRSQLVCTARRLRPEEGLPIVRNLLDHAEDASDPHIPLLLWWALEHSCHDSREAVVNFFKDSEVWRGPIARKTLLPRVMKRFALSGTQKDLKTCLELFRAAPDIESGRQLMQGFEEAFKGRSIAGLPAELLEQIGKIGGGSLMFSVRQGQPEAVKKALARVIDAKAPLDDRRELIEVLGETRSPQALPELLTLLEKDASVPLRASALTALQAYPNAEVGGSVLKLYPKLSPELRELAEGLLVTRKEWTRQWLSAIESGAVAADSVPLATVRKMLLHPDDGIAKAVRKQWGDVKGATSTQMKADIERFTKVVSTGIGNPYPGKKLFTTRCAVCHTLHSKGGQVGPDLTPFKRDDVPNLLLNIVNPSAEIREGYENHVVITESGRTLSGVVAEKDAQVVVLRTAEGQKIVVPKSDIAEMRVVGVSLMPEGLLQGLSDQEVRDLFAYLRSTQPLYDR
jgi:putative heme-binding domain-containing protein